MSGLAVLTTAHGMPLTCCDQQYVHYWHLHTYRASDMPTCSECCHGCAVGRYGMLTGGVMVWGISHPKIDTLLLHSTIKV